MFSTRLVKRFFSITPVEFYPLVGAVSFALGAGAVVTLRHLLYSQDVIVNKKDQHSWEDSRRFSLPGFDFFLNPKRLPQNVPHMPKDDIHY